MATRPALTKIGPEHDGIRMKLREFKEVEFEPGYTYELDRGVVVVADLPSYFHMLIVLAIRDALVGYKLQNPNRIFAVPGGGESGLEMPEIESRRHPDISVYLRPPPSPNAQPWDAWFPEIAVEVVSNSSRKRDYERKPPDYLEAGVQLYWIIDPLKRSATVLTRQADRWDETKLAAADAMTTGLLPGFSLTLAPIFALLPE